MLAFLRKLPASSLGFSQKGLNTSGKLGHKKFHNRVTVASMLMSSAPIWLPRTPLLPLSDGPSLGLVYLEWLVINMPVEFDSAPYIHDEYAKLLMDSIPSIRYLVVVCIFLIVILTYCLF